MHETIKKRVKSVIKYFSKIILIVISCLLSINFAQGKDKDDDDYGYNYAALSGKCGVYDPYEAYNRKVFMFNSVLDTFTLRPIAKMYGKFTNDYTKNRVGSFLDNIQEPLSTVNYGLQGKGEGAQKTFWRFMINSTLGVGGLFDVASKFDVKAEPQTFGNTLSHYGVGSGPYIILPFFPGAGARDFMDPLILNNYMNPLNYYLHSSFKNGVLAGGMIHGRHVKMPFTDYVSNNSPDPYIAIRDAILSEKEGRMDYPQNWVCPKVK